MRWRPPFVVSEKHSPPVQKLRMNLKDHIRLWMRAQYPLKSERNRITSQLCDRSCTHDLTSPRLSLLVCTMGIVIMPQRVFMSNDVSVKHLALVPNAQYALGK